MAEYCTCLSLILLCVITLANNYFCAVMSEALRLEKIREALAGDCNIRLLQSVDSTNEWLLQKVRAGARLPLACFAEQQTRGRGRRGKVWLSPPGAGISMSLAWQFDVPVSEIGALSLVMGLAVIQALEKAGICNAQLKWPNDVLVDDKKIAGILIETANISGDTVTVVTGVGLNYRLPAEPAEQPDQPWTDVVSQSADGAAIERSRLAGHLLQNCLMLCERYPQNRGRMVSRFMEKYDATGKQAVTVSLENGEQFHGTACGVTADGEIRILIEGKERLFNSAEISLRKGRPVQ